MRKRTLVIAGIFASCSLILFLVGRFGYKPPPSPRGRSAFKKEGNRVVIPLWDPRKARKFDLRAVLRKQSVFVFGQTAQEQTISFGEGEVTVPFDLPEGSDQQGGTFQLKFSEAVYRGIPGLSRSAHVTMPAPCTGILDDGKTKTVIQCKSLEVNWRSAEYLVLKTDKPVLVKRDNPELYLEAEAGLEGRFSNAEGQYVLRFPAPVRAWLTREQESTVLSLSPAKKEEPSGFICVRCEVPGGGMILNWKKNTISFDRQVVIFPTSDTKVPSLPPARRFECHRLVLIVDPKTKALKKAVAERGPDTTVRVYWDTLTLEGGQALWESRTSTARLTSRPHIWGKANNFRFDAEATRIDFDASSHVAILTGPIRSNLDHTELPEKLKLPGFWTLLADRAVIHFTSELAHKVTSIEASSDPTVSVQQGVRLESLPKGSFVVTGEKLTYEVEKQLLTIVGLPGRPPFIEVNIRQSSEKRPPRALNALRLSSSADHVKLDFSEGCVYLEQNVKAKLTRTLQGTERYFDYLRTDRLKLVTDKDSGDFLVEAWGKDYETPFVFDYDGPPRVQLKGGHLTWKGKEASLALSAHGPITRQQISFQSGTLSAKELEFNPKEPEAQAWAHNEVVAEFETDYGPIKIKADHAELTVDTTVLGSQGPPGLNALKKVKVWADKSQRVKLDHRKLFGSASRATYDASTGQLLLDGEGLQVLRLKGAVGIDQVQARVLKFSPKEGRISLVGEVRGMIHQGNWSLQAGEVDDKAPVTPWTYRADSAEIQLIGEDQKWRLGSLTCSGSVLLENKELQLKVTGSRLVFDASSRVITLGSDKEGEILQTIRFGGTSRQNLLSGRKITITRRERLKEGLLKPEIVAVLTKDVRCLLYLQELAGVKRVPKYAPEKLELSADKVVFVVPAGPGATSGLISYAHARGNVMFQGYSESGSSAQPAPYQGFGTEAFYTSIPLTFVILGDGGGHPATVRAPYGNVVSQVIQLRQRPDRTLEIRQGGGVDYTLPEPFRALRPRALKKMEKNAVLSD